MAAKNVIILKLVETYANLNSINPALGNGQEVIVDELATTYDVTNKPKKIGDGTTLFNALFFTDLIEIATDATYDLTQTYIAINDNRVQITNTHATNTISLTGTSFTLGPLATGSYKRISGTWYETGNYGQIQPWLITTTYGLDWLVIDSELMYISKQAGNTGHTPVGGAGDLWWKLWPEAEDVPIEDTAGYFTSDNVEDALAEIGTTKTKVVPIGDWNMDTTSDVTVAHGLDFTKIVAVTVLIQSDFETGRTLLNRGVNFSDTTPQGYIESIVSLNVTLTRLTGGFFDATAYDATSFNRGWIVITYTN